MRRLLPAGVLGVGVLGAGVLGVVVLGVVVLGACASNTAPRAVHSTAPTSPAPTTTGTGATTTTGRRGGPDLAAVRIRLQPVASGLSSPVAIAFRPARAGAGSPGTMYVVEQTGTLREIVGGRPAAQPALDLRANLSHGNEQGFLGAAFSPDGRTVYVHFDDRHGDTNVDAYRMRGAAADPASRRRVFFAHQPYSNHNGGEVTVGPDGMLYIGLGDGGSEGDPRAFGQDLASPLSKILRIDPAPAGGASYSVPADNPFVGRAGAFPETWMWGLRNPWRFSFDRATGDLWIGDVGQNLYEEIDYAPRGSRGVNFGWSAREGLHAFRGARPPGARDPIVELDHSAGWCAVVGGYVYRGRAIPALDGVYLFGDDCRPGIEGLVQRDGRVAARRDLGITVPALTTFGEDGAGELYVAARGGTISEIVAG